MLSPSVQGVKVQQKVPLHRRSHGEGPRHCQPHQLSDRTGHGCTWCKQPTAKRPGDGKDRRHRVMPQPLHIGDVASWHRVRRHPYSVGRRLVSAAVLLWPREAEKVAGKDCGWWLDPPRRCWLLSTFSSDLCNDRHNHTEAIPVSDKLSWQNIVQASENRDLHIHLLGCPEVYLHLRSAINANFTIMLVKINAAQVAALTNENVIFLFFGMWEKNSTRVLTISIKDLQLQCLTAGYVRILLHFSYICIFYQIQTEYEPCVLFCRMPLPVMLIRSYGMKVFHTIKLYFVINFSRRALSLPPLSSSSWLCLRGVQCSTFAATCETS